MRTKGLSSIKFSYTFGILNGSIYIPKLEDSKIIIYDFNLLKCDIMKSHYKFHELEDLLFAHNTWLYLWRPHEGLITIFDSISRKLLDSIDFKVEIHAINFVYLDPLERIIYFNEEKQKFYIWLNQN